MVIACSEQRADQGEAGGKGRVYEWAPEGGRQNFEECVPMERETGFKFTTLALKGPLQFLTLSRIQQNVRTVSCSL